MVNEEKIKIYGENGETYKENGVRFDISHYIYIYKKH